MFLYKIILILLSQDRKKPISFENKANSLKFASTILNKKKQGDSSYYNSQTFNKNLYDNDLFSTKQQSFSPNYDPNNYLSYNENESKNPNFMKYNEYLSQNNPKFKTPNFEEKKLQKITTEKRDLEVYCEKLQNDLKKTEILESELEKSAFEKRNLSLLCEKLQKELALAKSNNLLDYKAEYEALKKNYSILEQKLEIYHEEQSKKDFLLQALESRNIGLQEEVKVLNESLADKENYLFELKTLKSGKFNKFYQNQINGENEMRLIQRIKEQNLEIERLNLKKRDWENLKESLRGKDIEIIKLKEGNFNYECLVKRLTKELEAKNGSIIILIKIYRFIRGDQEIT